MLDTITAKCKRQGMEKGLYRHKELVPWHLAIQKRGLYNYS